MKVRKVIALIFYILFVFSCASGTENLKKRGEVFSKKLNVKFKSLFQAFLQAEKTDFLVLSEGTYVGEGAIKNKNLVISCASPGGCYVYASPKGIEIQNSTVTFENIKFIANPEIKSSSYPFIISTESNLDFVNCEFKSLKSEPILFTSSTGKWLKLIKSKFIGNKRYAVALKGGFLYVRQSIFFQNQPAVFLIRSELSGNFVTHSTFLQNSGFFEYSRVINQRLNLFYNIFDFNPGKELAKTNQSLNESEIKKLFLSNGKFKFKPNEKHSKILKRDEIGVEYGAVITDSTKKVLEKSIARFLKMEKSVSILKIIPFIATSDDIFEKIKKSFYRRLGTYIAGKLWGVAAADMLRILPYAPSGWFIKDRLVSVLGKIFEKGVKSIKLTPEDTFPEVEKKVNDFLLEYYPVFKKSENLNIEIQLIDDIKTKTEKAETIKTFEYENPDYKKIKRTLKMLDAKLEKLWKKKSQIELKIKGEQLKRKLKNIQTPTSYEKLQIKLFNSVLSRINKVLDDKKRMNERLKNTPVKVKCTFKSTKIVETTKGMFFIGKKYYFSPEHQKVRLQIEPEKNCNFDGFIGVWESPQSKNWLTESIATFIIYKFFVEKDFDLIENLIFELSRSGKLSLADKNELFGLIIKNYKILKKGFKSQTSEQKTGFEDKILKIELDDQGYPQVKVVFNPALKNEIATIWAHTNKVRNTVFSFWLNTFYEPFELIVHELEFLTSSN